MNRLGVVLSSLLLGACSVVGIRSGTEQPDYVVVATLADDIEIRRYPSRLVAEVEVEGAEEDARSTGFRKLAAFIFGENEPRRSIAMTAPVGQAPATERIATTAPVGQTESDADKWRIWFHMPAEYGRETLPRPLDPDIAIRELDAATLAVLRFSGSRSAAAVHAARLRLEAALAAAGWRIEGPPVALFYDPPWTPAFLRRNEIAIPVGGNG